MDDDACTHYFKIFIAHVPPPCSTLFWTPPGANAAAGGPIGRQPVHCCCFFFQMGHDDHMIRLATWASSCFVRSGTRVGLQRCTTPERNGWMLYNPAKDRASPFLVVGRRGATGPRAQALFLPPGRNKSDPLNLASETAREQFRRHHISSLNLPV